MPARMSFRPASSTCMCISTIPPSTYQRISTSARQMPRSAVAHSSSNIPFPGRPTTTAAHYADKRDRAASRAFVDFGLWGVLTARALGSLADSASSGAVGFKAFLPDNNMDFPPASDDDLCHGLALSRERWICVLLVHAEDRRRAQVRHRARRQAGRTDYAAVLVRPPEVEINAVRHVLELAEDTGGAIHLVHLSVPESVDLVAAARERGVRASCEATPHHLLLDAESFAELGWRGLCAPPLRPCADVEGLWQRLRDGLIDVVASDHCPSARRQAPGRCECARWPVWDSEPARVCPALPRRGHPSWLDAARRLGTHHQQTG